MDVHAGCKTSGLTANPLELQGDWLAFLQGIADEVVFQQRGVTYPPYPWTPQGCLKKVETASG